MLEGVPEGVDVESIKKIIYNTAPIKGIDDMHIWSLSSHEIALSCHIQLDKEKSLSHCAVVVKQIKQRLKEAHGILHTTIEVELEACESSS